MKKAKDKVFVLGDSRTGTTTIHKFLKLVGYNSIHYFFNESGITDPVHTDFLNNWNRLTKFVETSEYNAFSDYPLRCFYKELFQKYPDAVFILSVRKDLKTWRRSMENFFSKFNIELNFESLSGSYERINEEIRQLARDNNARFCEVCIDDDAGENGKLISDTLGLDKSYSLGWENQTASYDNSIWSSRVTLYNTKAEDFIEYIKRVTYPSKAMLSEYGWAYLINDSSDFIDYCYGGKVWPEESTAAVVKMLASRAARVEELNATYLKFVVPEKCVVYPDYLPKLFQGKKPSAFRPAAQVDKAELDFVHYLEPLLNDARSYGNVYFRGDSHTNWLGAYFVYHYIAERINDTFRSNESMAKKRPIQLGELRPSLAKYGGDLFSQLETEFRNVLQGAWRPLSLGESIEHLVRYTLPDEQRTAQRVPVEQEYLDLLGDRETFRFVNSNKSLPKAVIFRDSTSDFIVEFLAEHFSESLFIWHKGLVYKDVIIREQPDIVLHIVAERFVVTSKNAPSLCALGLK